MAHLDSFAREVVAKIVYYGPALAGKTTNLQAIYDSLPADQRGPLLPIATATGQTVFFDLLAPGLGQLHGMTLRCQLCTVDGPLSSQATQLLLSILREADAIVFVVDSQSAAIDRDVACLESLERVLLDERPTTPFVIQFNKQDLPTALPLHVLGERLNRRRVPAFQAIAHKDIGVGETWRVVLRRCFNALSASDLEALTPPASDRRATARFTMPALQPSAVPPSDVEKVAAVRRGTEHSLAGESLSGDNRYLTIPLMPRDAFLAAARQRGATPSAPPAPADPAARRHDTVRWAPKPEDDEQTRPLRLSTAQSMAGESRDATSASPSRPRIETSPQLLDPAPLPPPVATPQPAAAATEPHVTPPPPRRKR